MEHDVEERVPRGRVAKRQAILAAARRVFGRDGYTGAGIETIAAEAGVSTRTIYNHFDSKQHLFTALIHDSSTQVVQALRDLIDRHLGPVTDAAELPDALVALGRDWSRPQAEFADHFAIVRHLSSEAASLPSEVLTVWNTAGPWRAKAELARHLRRLAADGILDLDAADPGRLEMLSAGPEVGHAAALAADHFLLLTAGAIDNRSYQGAIPLADEQASALVTAGVRAFLNGYRPRSAGDRADRAVRGHPEQPHGGRR
jgi:AcrR family transcriptional regulator